jgi:hypothetical protein
MFTPYETSKYSVIFENKDLTVLIIKEDSSVCLTSKKSSRARRIESPTADYFADLIQNKLTPDEIQTICEVVLTRSQNVKTN